MLQKLKQLKTIKFSIDGGKSSDIFEGFDSGHTWNGWLVPLVNANTKKKLEKWHKANMDKLAKDGGWTSRYCLEELNELFDGLCDFSATESDEHGLFKHDIGYCWAHIVD